MCVACVFLCLRLCFSGSLRCVWEVEGEDRMCGKLAAETPGLISGRGFNLTCKCYANKETHDKVCLEGCQDIARCFSGVKRELHHNVY